MEFMQNLPYCFELEDFYLVHAGFNFEKEKPFEDHYAMIWIMNFEPDAKLLQGKRIVHGHIPTSLEEIKERIQKKDTIIRLDNGIYHHYKSRYQGRGTGMYPQPKYHGFISAKEYR